MVEQDEIELGIVVPVNEVETYVHPEDMARKYTGSTIIWRFDKYTFTTVADKIEFDGVHGDRVLVKQNGKESFLLFLHRIREIKTPKKPDELISPDYDWLRA